MIEAADAMVKAANLMARKEKIADRGYRLVINCGVARCNVGLGL